MNDTARRLATLLGTAGDRLKPVIPLLTRLVIGHAFVLTGLGKWNHFSNTAAFFEESGIPLPTVNAAFVSTLEVMGGAAVILGLGTRILSALLASTMVVALLTADRVAFVGALGLSPERGFTEIPAFVFLLFLAWLVARGAGPVSIDAALAGRRRRTHALCGKNGDRNVAAP